MPTCVLVTRFKHSASSHRWLQRQIRDPYVKASNKFGLRSRAGFKLQEMNERFNFLRQGQQVLDLGAAPGSWSEYAKQIIGPRGQVVAVDLLTMDPIENVTFLKGDFSVLQTRIQHALAGGNSAAEGPWVDIILSDMAPPFSGDYMRDHLRTVDLCFQVLGFTEDVLVKEGQGTVLLKYLQGREEGELKARARTLFHQSQIVKPKSSRKESSERYLLLRDRKLR